MILIFYLLLQISGNSKLLITRKMQNTDKKKITLEKLQNLYKIAMKLIKQLAITQKSKKISQQTKLRNLSDINANLYQIEKINPLQNQSFADEKLIVFVRHFLIDNSPNNNKIPPLQFLRLILVSQNVADKFLAHSIPIFIARVIERDDISKAKSSMSSHFQEQTFQALRLIKHWIDKFPSKFPQYLAFSLIALGELPVATTIDDKKKDQIPQHIKTFVIDIILLLATKNTKLCCICGGFALLVNSITDPVFHEKSYDIISRMMIFINDTKYREMTSAYIDFKRVFHVLTDLDNVFLQQGYKTRNNLEMLSKFQSKLGLAKTAIITLLKSWIGLIYIGNQPTALHSLLQTLKQVPKKYDSELRNLIFELLEEIISVGDSIITASTSQQKHIFKVSNLIGCYLMTVVELLIQQNLLRILIQLSGVEDSLVSEPSQRLLKRLTFLIFSYRPQYSKYIDFLITAANKSNGNANQVLKTSSSFVINKIGNYIYDKKQKKNHPMFNQLQNLFSLKSIIVPYSRASLNSISKTLNFINYKQKSQYRKNLLQKDPISKQNKQDYQRWRWDVIQNLLQFPDPDKFRSSNNQRYREKKMYKYLLKFYSPTRGSFPNLDWHMYNFNYIKVGMHLIRSCITIPQNISQVKVPPESQFQCTVSFIGDLQKCLEINITQCIKDSKQWNIVLCTKLQRELLGFIGLISQTKLGYESLICENRFMELLQRHLNRQQCSHLIYLILINFDFYRDDLKKLIIRQNNVYLPPKLTSVNTKTNSLNLPANYVIENQYKIGVRHLLQTCVKQGSPSLKLGCIEIIKILLAAEVYQFTIFSYQLLISVLQSQPEKSQIIKVVVQFLQQNLTNKNNVELFLKVLSNMIIDFDVRPPNFQKTNSDSSNDKLQNKMEEKKLDSQQQVNKNLSYFSNSSKPLTFAGPRLRFDEIKQKLTNPIILRLLSHDSGIELAERYFPDWLQEQFDKWMASDHNYCTTLQSKLNGVLNFAKKKEKGYYKITSNSHLYDLFFFYKLPWVLHVNQSKFPLWIRQRGQSYQFYINFHAGENNFYISNDSLKIMLGIGTMLVDEQFHVASGSDTIVPLTIFLTMSPKQVELYGQKMYLVESNGVEVYYRKYNAGFDKNAMKDRKQQMSEQEQWEYYNSHVQDLNKLQIVRIIINVKLPTVEHTQQLPLHLINVLTKTEKGWKFIEKKKYIQKAANVIQNFVKGRAPTPSPAEVRSTLWSLGFFGARNKGIKILASKGIFNNIVHMTFNSPVLSLRGTCRYILNMFSHSEHGRNLLSENGFHVNSSCFTCYPVQTSKFYSIQWSPLGKRHFIMDQKYWQSYNLLQKPMTKNEQKLFELISLLINSLSFKSAVTQIRQILKISSKLSNSINLFQNVINLLTFFKYKHQSRKSIMNLFEQLIRSPDFNSENANKIIFYTNEEGTERKMSIQQFSKSQSKLQQMLEQKFEQKIKTQNNLLL